MSFSFSFDESALNINNDYNNSDEHCHFAVSSQSSQTDEVDLSGLAPAVEISQPTNIQLSNPTSITLMKGLCVSVYNPDAIDGVIVGKDIYDLIPHVNEGGHKIWECSIDLANYLIESCSEDTSIQNKSVLELGCGYGIPGCLALKLGYRKVVFTDFNEDVIRHCTWRTICGNIRQHIADRVKTFAGDWLTISETLQR